VIRELAKPARREAPGFDMTAWEIMDATLRRSGMWDAETNWQRGGQDHAATVRDGALPRRVRDGRPRFHFRADWSRFGGRWREMPTLPDHFDVIDNPTRTSRSGWSPLRRARVPELELHGDTRLAPVRAAADRVARSARLAGLGVAAGDPLTSATNAAP